MRRFLAASAVAALLLANSGQALAAPSSRIQLSATCTAKTLSLHWTAHTGAPVSRYSLSVTGDSFGLSTDQPVQAVHQLHGSARWNRALLGIARGSYRISLSLVGGPSVERTVYCR